MFRTVTYVFQTISACGSEHSPSVLEHVQNSHLCVSDHQCMWSDYQWMVTRVFQNVNVRDGELPEDAVQIQPQSVRITIRPSKLPSTVHQPCWFPCHLDGAVSVTVVLMASYIWAVVDLKWFVMVSPETVFDMGELGHLLCACSLIVCHKWS